VRAGVPVSLFDKDSKKPIRLHNRKEDVFIRR
jgi:hypothetical protein